MNNKFVNNGGYFPLAIIQQLDNQLYILETHPLDLLQLPLHFLIQHLTSDFEALPEFPSLVTIEPNERLITPRPGRDRYVHSDIHLLARVC